MGYPTSAFGPSGLLPCVEIEPRDGPARASVIWLHGLGADGHDFEPIVPELGLDSELALRFVFPHAPRISVTINGGFVMPAWYDLFEPDLERRHDEAGIRGSAAAIERLIAREHRRGVPSERIALAGFSQGGAIALHVGLRHGEPLAGIAALSTYVVLEDSLERERNAANAHTPIFQAHGASDPMVPLARGRAAHATLERLGYSVGFHVYPMQHQVCAEEIRDLGHWFAEVLAQGAR